MKPRLPEEIETLFPTMVLHEIYKFVPHLPKPKKSPKLETLDCSVSPNMDRDLRLIQHKMLKGKNEMYLKELDDFVLR